MTAVHEVPPDLFTRLAGGGGGADGVHLLKAASVSKHLLLIGFLVEHGPGPTGGLTAVVDTLERVRRQSPAAFREVVGAPMVGAWAAIAARAARRGALHPTDLSQLAAVTAVACAAGGVDGDLEVAAHDGIAALPTLGAVATGASATARIVVRQGRITARSGGRVTEVPEDRSASTASWFPVRRLVGDSAAAPMSLDLDDLDPYRHGYHAPPAPRLSPAEFGGWQDLFADAWGLIVDWLPERASELQAGLGTLVPLVNVDRRSARSATLRHVFGAFGATMPNSAVDLAVTIVHEFQHSKLSALLDLTPLSDPADQRRYFAPWRTDPRPLSGLIQGVYAFIGVADTWRALRGSPDVGGAAELRFAESRLQLDRALVELESSAALTPAGTELAVQLRRATDRLLAEPLPAAVTREAARALAETQQRWQQANSR